MPYLNCFILLQFYIKLIHKQQCKLKKVTNFYSNVTLLRKILYFADFDQDRNVNKTMNHSKIEKKLQDNF